MDILGTARRLESKLARTLDRAAQQWTKSGPREPLEVLQAIVDAVEERLEPAGRGTHVFPFNKIKVSVVAPSRETRVRFAALFDGDPTLQDRIAKRLRAAGCDAADVNVKIAYVAHGAPDWTRPDLHIEFDRVAPAEAPPERTSVPDTVRLTVIHGAAEKPAYVFSLARVNLGRCAEVRDSLNRLIRTNQVVFSEGATGANSSVSRRHAHIEYASGPGGQYRICDDRSEHGTGIVRNGRTINVPSGVRGIRLQSGDEVLLGEARLRVKIERG
jgi:hypothetical protein